MDESQALRLADGTACLQAALEYLSMGWSVLALCPHDHVGIDRVVPKHSKNCASRGKRPWHTWTEYQTQLPTEEEVSQWWRSVPNSNVGLALGPVSGLIRIDVEGESGEARLAELSKGDLPDTLEFTSGRDSGGRGLLYAIPAGVTLKTTYEKPKPNEELRLQAKGAQTVLPPSRHPSGRLYEWKEGHGPHDRKAAMAPAWLLKELADKAGANGKHRSSADWDAIFSGVTTGSRNDSAASLIGKILGDLKDIESQSSVKSVWQLIKLWNEKNDPPMDEAELKTVFASILRKETQTRQTEDSRAFETIVGNQIEVSVAQSTEKPNELPDCHLVIVESDPPEFRLRMPEWKDSPRLKDGYIILDSRQVRQWSSKGNGIPQAAWDQAFILVTPVMKGWSKPGGNLEALKQIATYLKVAPERQRELYIVGFIYRYLAAAKEVKVSEDGSEKWSSSGSPTIAKDGTTWFKLANLRQAIGFAREDFSIKDATRIMESAGVKTGVINNSRWWKVSKDVFNQMGKQTEEMG